MIKYWLITFLFLFSFSLYAQGKKEKIIAVIDEEIKEVENLYAQSRGEGKANLLLKKAELFLEKGRIIREIENERFLSISPEKRKSINENTFFRSSRNNFIKAQGICQKIIRSYPSYKYLGDVYFILAYYSKELGDNRKALQNFNRARMTSQDEGTQLKSEIAMAEIFYSLNRCKQAVSLYSSAIPKVQGKWKTKDLYNYSWCLYKTNRHDEAITAMKESYRLSQRPEYIDMGNRVQKDIIIFYVAAGQLREGMNFIEKMGGDKKDAVLDIVSRLKEGGQDQLAQGFLIRLVQQSSGTSKFDYYQILFSTYAKAQWRQIGKTAHILLKYKSKKMIPEKNLKAIQKQSLSYMGLYQRDILNKKLSLKKKRERAKVLEVLGELGKSENSLQNNKISLALAESHAMVKSYKKSLEYYLEISKSTGSEPLRRIALEGALKLSQHFSHSPEDLPHLEEIYQSYIDHYPSSLKSEVLYEKLIQVYLKQGKLKKADASLLKYQGQFPLKRSKQGALLMLLLDGYHKNNQYFPIQKWVNRIEKQKNLVSPEYRKRVESLSNTIVEKRVQLHLQKGDWKKAVLQYEKAYTENQNQSTKADIALNIAQIYETKKVYHLAKNWLEKSIQLMNSKQVLKSEGIVNNLSLNLFYEGYTDTGQTVLKAAWKKNCRIQSYFTNTLILLNAIEKKGEMREVYEHSSRCGYSSSFRRSIYQKFFRKEQRKKPAVDMNKKLRKEIQSISFSRQSSVFEKQVKRSLHLLSKMNIKVSNMSLKASSYMESFVSLVKSYGDIEKKMTDFLRKNKDYKSSLGPVVKSLNLQRRDLLKKIFQDIHRTKAYSLENQKLLKLMEIKR